MSKLTKKLTSLFTSLFSRGTSPNDLSDTDLSRVELTNNDGKVKRSPKINTAEVKNQVDGDQKVSILRIIEETKKAFKISEIDSEDTNLRDIVTKFIKLLNSERQKLKDQDIDNKATIKSIDIIDTYFRKIYYQIASFEIEEYVKNINSSEVSKKDPKEKIFALLDKADHVENELKKFLDGQDENLISLRNDIDAIEDETKKEHYLKLLSEIHVENYYPEADKINLSRNHIALLSGKFYLITNLISKTPDIELPQDLKDRTEKSVNKSVLEYISSEKILNTLKNGIQDGIKKTQNNKIEDQLLKKLPENLQANIEKIKNDLIFKNVSHEDLKDLIFNFITDKNNIKTNVKTKSNDDQFNIDKVIKILAELSVNSELDTEDRIEYETKNIQIEKLHSEIKEHLEKELPPVPKKIRRTDNNDNDNDIGSAPPLPPREAKIPLSEKDLNAVKKNQDTHLNSQPEIQNSSLKQFVDNKTAQQDVAELWNALNESFYKDRVFITKSSGHNVQIISNSGIIQPIIEDDAQKEISVENAFESIEEIVGSVDINQVRDEDRENIYNNPNQYTDIVLDETNSANNQDKTEKLRVKYVLNLDEQGKEYYTKKLFNEQEKIWKDVVGSELSKSGRGLAQDFKTNEVQKILLENKQGIISAATIQNKTIKTRIHLVDEQRTFTSYIPRNGTDVVNNTNIKKTNKLNNNPIQIDGKSFEITSYVVHYGDSTNSGHYTTVFLASDNKWYEADDNTVKEVKMGYDTIEGIIVSRIEKNKLDYILRNCVLVNYSSKDAIKPSKDDISGTTNNITIDGVKFKDRCFINATFAHATTLLQSSQKPITKPEITKAQIKCAINIVDNFSNISDQDFIDKSFEELIELIKDYKSNIQKDIIENTIKKIESTSSAKDIVSYDTQKIRSNEKIKAILDLQDSSQGLGTAHQINMGSGVIKNLESLREEKDADERAKKREEILKSWSENSEQLKPHIKDLKNQALEEIINSYIKPNNQSDQEQTRRVVDYSDLAVQTTTIEKPQEKQKSKLGILKKIKNFLFKQTKEITKKAKSQQNQDIDSDSEGSDKKVIDIKKEARISFSEFGGKKDPRERISSLENKITDLKKKLKEEGKSESVIKDAVEEFIKEFNSELKNDALEHINKLVKQQNIVEYLSRRQNMELAALEQEDTKPQESWKEEKTDPKDVTSISLALKQVTSKAESTTQKAARFKKELSFQMFDDALFEANKEELKTLQDRFIVIMQKIFRGTTGYEEKLETENNHDYFAKLISNAASFFANEAYNDEKMLETCLMLAEVSKIFYKIDVKLRLNEEDGPKKTTDNLLKMSEFFWDNYTEEKIYSTREEGEVLKQLLKNVDPQSKKTAITLGIELMQKLANNDSQENIAKKIKEVKGKFDEIISSKITDDEKTKELSSIIQSFQSIDSLIKDINLHILESVVKIFNGKTLEKKKHIITTYRAKLKNGEYSSQNIEDLILTLTNSAKVQYDKKQVQEIKNYLEQFISITNSKKDDDTKLSLLLNFSNNIIKEVKEEKPEQKIGEQSLEIEGLMLKEIKNFCKQTNYSDLEKIIDNFIPKVTSNDKNSDTIDKNSDTILKELDQDYHIKLSINDAAHYGKITATEHFIQLLDELEKTETKLEKTETKLEKTKTKLEKIKEYRKVLKFNLNIQSSEEKEEKLSDIIKELNPNETYSDDIDHRIFEKSYDIQNWILKEIHNLLEEKRGVIEKSLDLNKTESLPEQNQKTTIKNLSIELQVKNSHYKLLKSWEESLKEKGQEIMARKIRGLANMLIKPENDTDVESQNDNSRKIKFELLKLFFSTPDLALAWTNILKEQTDLPKSLDSLVKFCEKPEKNVEKGIDQKGRYQFLIESIKALKNSIKEAENYEFTGSGELVEEINEKKLIIDEEKKLIIDKAILTTKYKEGGSKKMEEHITSNTSIVNSPSRSLENSNESNVSTKPVENNAPLTIARDSGSDSNLATNKNNSTTKTSPKPTVHPVSSRSITQNDEEITGYVQKFLEGNFIYSPASNEKDHKVIGKLLSGIYQDQKSNGFVKKITAPYRGIGLNVDYSSKEIKIKNIFSSEFGRFKEVNTTTYLEADSLKNNFITEISTDGGKTWKKIGEAEGISVEKALKLFRDPHTPTIHFKARLGKSGPEKTIECSKQLFITRDHDVGKGDSFSRTFLQDRTGKRFDGKVLKHTDITKDNIKEIFGDKFIRDCKNSIASINLLKNNVEDSETNETSR